MSERILSGDRLYVDIVEVNPPASVWIYLPLVWLAQALSVWPEAVVATAFFVGGLSSIAITAKLASRLKDAPSPLLLSAVLGFALLILPMGLFAQREHAALLLALPSLAALALIADGKTLTARATFAAGVAAGLVIVIKPHFALAMLPPAVWTAWSRRSLSPILPGVAGAATPVVVYAIALFAVASAYMDWLPVFTHIYARAHAPMAKVLLGTLIFPLAALLPTLLLRRQRRMPSLAIAFGLAAAGFTLASMIQAKNYPNHWLPGSTLALLAAFAVAASPFTRPHMRAFVSACLVFAGVWQVCAWKLYPNHALAAEIERVAPPKPTVIGLSRQLTSGHPITRQIGGRWVGSRAALFTAGAARGRMQSDLLAEQSYREDIHSFARDVAKHRPDMVLVDTPDKDWFMNEPEIARAMSAYRAAARVGNTEVWLRR